MKYKINVNGGGIFSKYMIVIQNCFNLNFDGFYINITDGRTNSNMFDYILQQNLTDDLLSFDCKTLPPYTNSNAIERSNNILKYKNIIKNFKFRENIIEKTNELKEKYGITNKTIGVHIRLTDMNIHHRNIYGKTSLENYLPHLNSDDEYFVASDNDESLEKLQKIFGSKIKFLPNLIRGKSEKEDTLELQLKNFKNPLFWEEAFIEMLLLSECGSLICSTSNLVNASIIHSDTIANIIRV